MKTKFLAIALLFIVGGCLPIRQHLKGEYVDKIEWRDVNKPYDVAFDDVIDWMVERGYSLENKLDRNNGVAQVDTWFGYWMVENEQDHERNLKKEPNRKYIAVTSLAGQVSFYGKITIRVKVIDKERTRIGIRFLPYAKLANGVEDYEDVKSTGVYENQILDVLSR